MFYPRLTYLNHFQQIFKDFSQDSAFVLFSLSGTFKYYDVKYYLEIFFIKYHHWWKKARG